MAGAVCRPDAAVGSARVRGAGAVGSAVVGRAVWLRAERIAIAEGGSVRVGRSRGDRTPRRLSCLRGRCATAMRSRSRRRPTRSRSRGSSSRACAAWCWRTRGRFAIRRVARRPIASTPSTSSAAMSTASSTTSCSRSRSPTRTRGWLRLCARASRCALRATPASASRESASTGSRRQITARS